MNSKLLIGIVAAAAVLILAVSFIFLGVEINKAKHSGVFDKAGIIYKHGEAMLAAGNTDKAVSAFVVALNQFPDSAYAEKSLRKLSEIYTSKEDFEKAKYYDKRLLNSFPNIEDAVAVRARVDELNMKIIKSPSITEDSMGYTVQAGDSLYAIAKKFNTTVTLLKKMNNLTGDIIRKGQKLKVNVSKFSIFVDKSENILILKKDGEPFKTYDAATGKNNSTPVGTFTITDKAVKPDWNKKGVGLIKPDNPEYALGERWMAISVKGYGIHGTNDDTSIGKQSTDGCVRMHNDDVVELYDIVTKGTAVEIVD